MVGALHADLGLPASGNAVREQDALRLEKSPGRGNVVHPTGGSAHREPYLLEIGVRESRQLK